MRNSINPGNNKKTLTNIYRRCCPLREWKGRHHPRGSLAAPGLPAPGVPETATVSHGLAAPGLPETVSVSHGLAAPGLPETVTVSHGLPTPGLPETVTVSHVLAAPGIPGKVTVSYGCSSVAGHPCIGASPECPAFRGSSRAPG